MQSSEGNCSSEVPRPRSNWHWVVGPSYVFSLAHESMLLDLGHEVEGLCSFQTDHLLVLDYPEVSRV